MSDEGYEVNLVEFQPRQADISSLYARPMSSTRSGALFNAFSYPTKIDPEAIAVFVAAHTEPGATVLDPFGGSGTTGIAARLCESPTPRMRSLADQMGIEPAWGPRNAVVYELSPLGALVSRVLSAPPDPRTFATKAIELLDEAEADLRWMYEADDPSGQAGTVRHIIWSEVLQTPCCGAEITFWDACVGHDPLRLATDFRCPGCSKLVQANACARVLTEAGTRLRVPAWVWGRTGKSNWDRGATAADNDLVDKVAATDVNPAAPDSYIAWGDLYRSGYHAGINKIQDLYTPRNFRVFAHLWALASREGGLLGDALKLWLLSYNSTHSTLMTRVVVKTGQKDFVITGAQSGVLYVSGLPVEKNIVTGLHRKVKTFKEAFALTYGGSAEINVVNASSTSLDIPDGTIDYVFTDPPFGDFIPYAEINQVNEAWLGALTDQTEEAIISSARGKGIDHYRHLVRAVFAEVSRVLKPAGMATVVFHASKPAVWAALGEAFDANGLAVSKASVWDKIQVSFKQAVHDGGTRHDALFMLRPRTGAPTRTEVSRLTSPPAITPESIIASSQDLPGTQSPRILYTRYVTACLSAGQAVALTAPDFYARVRELTPKTEAE